MSSLNENNRGNFEEIEGHCRILTAKLAQLTERDQAAATALEDLCDYYERGLQMRIFHNTTLTEEIKELKVAHAQFVNAIVLWALAAAGVGGVTIIFMYPMVVASIVGAYWSHVAVAGVSVGATFMLRNSV